MKILAITLLGIVAAVSALFGHQYYNNGIPVSLGAFTDPFLSIQLASSPSSGNCLTTDGTNNVWDTCATGGGGGTDGNWVYVSSGNYSRNATTTSGILTQGSSTITQLTMVRSTTTNATTTGNFTSQGTTIIGSLTGLLKAASGVVTTATAGTDYENPLTFSAPLSRAVNTISCITATWSVAGCLSTTDFATFQNKISSTSLSWTDTSQIDGTYTSSSGVFTASVVADSIGDTQLAFNTGQNLTTASDVTFSEATTTGFFSTVASSTLGFVQSFLAKHATTTDLSIGGQLTFAGTSGTTWSAFCTAITGGAGLCDGTDATGGGGGTDANWSYTAPNTYISPATSTNGIIVLASSTIGAGTQASGLTINGGATTTDLVIANSLRFNGVTGSTWASFCTTITGSAALCDGNDASGGGASFGQGWDLNTAGQLAPTTTKTVAAQAFVATSTATSTFTGGIQTAGLNATGFVTLMGETFTNFTTYVRSLITEGTGIDIASGVVSVEPDSIGDTQLTFNTGQHLTTTSDVTFSEATTTSFFSTIASSTSAFFTNLLASNATTTNLSIGGQLSFGGVSGTAWSAFCTSITGGAGLCDGTDATGGGGSGSDVNWSYTAPNTYISPATSTNGIIVTASSTINGLTIQGNSTTTRLFNAGGYGSTLQAGITSPIAFLTSSTTSRSGIIIQNYGTGTAPESRFIVGDPYKTNEYLAFGLTNDNVTTPGTIATLNKSNLAYILSNLSRDLYFGTFSSGDVYIGAANASAPAQFMIDDATGRIGINIGTTTTPTSTLSVNGEIYTRDFVSDRWSTTTNATTTGNFTSLGTTIIGTFTGLLKAANGIVSAAVAGTDYEVPLTFSAPLSRAVNTISCVTATWSVAGCLSTTDFATFQNKISSTSLSWTDTSQIDGTYTSATGVFTASVVADSIGDTQLAFNTGQHLTTTSDVSFSEATTTSFFSTVASSTSAFFGNLFATNATTTGTHWINNLKLGNPLSTLYGGTGTSTAVLLYKPTAIQVTSGSSAITTGDGKAYFRIPQEYNGMNLVDVNIAVTASTTSNYIEVQLARGRQASAGVPHTFVDMLSTTVTIDTNEYDSQYSATTTVINSSNDDVTEGDLIRVDVDKVGSGPTAVLIVQPVFALP